MNLRKSSFTKLGIPCLIYLTVFLAATQDLASSTVLGAMAAPPFHAMGIWAHILFPFSRGGRIVLWAPESPPPVPTPENTLMAMRIAKCDVTIVVPTFLVSWARDRSALRFLSEMELVVCIFDSLYFTRWPSDQHILGVRGRSSTTRSGRHTRNGRRPTRLHIRRHRVWFSNSVETHYTKPYGVELDGICGAV